MLNGDSFEYFEMRGVSHFFEPWQELLNMMDKILSAQGDIQCPIKYSSA